MAASTDTSGEPLDPGQRVPRRIRSPLETLAAVHVPQVKTPGRLRRRQADPDARLAELRSESDARVDLDRDDIRLPAAPPPCNSHLVMTPERLAAYRRLLSEEGKVTRWPKKDHEKQFVLEYLGEKFTKDVKYRESEVNAILKEWHLFGDHALLRRELFDRYLLNRTADGKEYWI
jgi:hypothetical protein